MHLARSNVLHRVSHVTALQQRLSTRPASTRPPRKLIATPTASLSFAGAPLAVVVGGVLSVAGFASFLIYSAMAQGKQQQAGQEVAAAPQEEVLPKENAVLVFGASGRTGRQVVAALITAGRTVVAAVRSADTARAAFTPLGLAEGRQPGDGGILFIQPGVDVTNAATLTADLFSGVDQVVSTVGSVFGRGADGTMGYLDGMSSERVDAGGVANIAAAAARHLPRPRRTVTEILPMRSAEDLAAWQRLDDVIMGGQSSSGLEAAPDGAGAVWRGQLITEGGGFCGARTMPMQLDLSAYDGIALRVKADGQTFKLNLKTDTFSEPEDTYQATFDAPPAGDWATVFIPWHEFVPVKRAKTVPGGPPLDPSRIRQVGLVYSRFAFNGFPNEAYAPGPFEMHLQGGISAFTAPRPQLLMLSSAGVERNARIGDDEAARRADIPIVQLNPGGVLNHKYAGEAAVRASGLAYAVIRPTGMSDDGGGEGIALLEASQGDRISGKIARGEVAAVIAAAAGLPSAAMKTLEVRRQAAGDAQGRSMADRDMLRLFLGAAPDAVRARVGLEPFPPVAPPPPPPSEQRMKEILGDQRVQAAQARNAGGRVRGDGDAAAAGSANAAAAPAPAPAEPAKAQQESQQQEEKPVEAQRVREWIRKWRARTLEKQLPEGAAAAKSE